jgi:hypothetical protein
MGADASACKDAAGRLLSTIPCLSRIRHIEQVRLASEPDRDAKWTIHMRDV